LKVDHENGPVRNPPLEVWARRPSHDDHPRLCGSRWCIGGGEEGIGSAVVAVRGRVCGGAVGVRLRPCGVLGYPNRFRCSRSDRRMARCTLSALLRGVDVRRYEPSIRCGCHAWRYLRTDGTSVPGARIIRGNCGMPSLARNCCGRAGMTAATIAHVSLTLQASGRT
jgi:hypothetical protein